MDPLSVRLDEEVRSEIERLASDDERSLSSYINRVLRAHIEAVRSKTAGAKSGRP